MTHQPYTYTILRYVHDIRTGEFLNVGVVLHVPATHNLVEERKTRDIPRVSRQNQAPGVEAGLN
jgi:hypothetical protein